MNEQVSKLDVRTEELEPKNLLRFTNMLSQCTELKSLRCEKKKELDPKVWDQVFSSISNLGIRDLLLGQNENAEVIVESLWKMTEGKRLLRKLKALSLCYGKIGNKSMSTVANILKSTRIALIGLCGGNITSVGLALLNSTEVMKNLQIIYLNNNPLGSDGLTVLSQGLKGKTNLLEIYLSQCELGNEGLYAFGEALLHNKSLYRLDMSNNSISSAGLAAFSRSFINNSTLKLLYFNHNLIGDQGLKSFTDCFKHYSGLEKLYLSNNRITHEGLKFFAKGFKGVNTIQKLHLTQTDLNPIIYYRQFGLFEG